MDGTLIDSEPLHFQSMAHALASVGIAADAGLQAKTAGLSESEVLDFCRSGLGITISHERWAALRNGYYLTRAQTLKARQGALPAFLRLKRSGVPQAVVSNSARPIVDANLRALSLHDKTISISRNDVRMPKPDPEPYFVAAAAIGLDPVKCLVVEDSLAGARSGIAAGMHVLYWPETVPRDIPEGPVTYVHSATDLETRLVQLLGRAARLSGTG